MYTNGFVPVASDAVTIGTQFAGTINGKLQNVVSAYITVGTGGDLVWMNQYGDLCWSPGLLSGQTYVIGAIKIVASGTVNGTARTTTASSMTWYTINTESQF